MSFSQILRELRIERGITQTELAKQCGVSSQCISSLEVGRRSPTGSTIEALSKYFNVSTDYLLGRTDDFGQIINAEASPKITPLELDLIENFRKLPAQTQDYVVGIVKNLARS